MSRWTLFWNQLFPFILFFIAAGNMDNIDNRRLLIGILLVAIISCNWLEFKMKNKWEK